MDNNQELIRIETTVEFIKEKLTEHIASENTRYLEMQGKFAKKQYEEIIEKLVDRTNDMPDRLSKRFAGVWVETYTKATAFTVIGSILVAIALKLIL